MASVEFMMEERLERLRATHRGRYERPARTRAGYRPDGLSHVDRNIRPAAR